jgi:hypothetical protein
MDNVTLKTATSVNAKMSKREAANLVRFLTDAIADSPNYLLDVQIHLKNDYDGSMALIAVGGNTLFGSSAVITEAREISYEQATPVEA